MNGLIGAIILTILPISELRGGLPVALIWANSNGINPLLIFPLILLINFIIVILAFLFLDKAHIHLLKNPTYEKYFNKYLKRAQKKADKLQNKFKSIGFLALILFVATPIPISGAYTGTMLSWLLNLDRKKSILSIFLGITIAGIIVYAATLGLFSIF